MPRRLLLIALLAAAGCGGTDAPTAQTATQPAPPPEPATTPQPEATDTPRTVKTTPEAVEPAKRALKRDGYDVRNSAVEGIPGATGALELPLRGGGDLTVIAFETRQAAEKHAEQYRDLAEQFPENLKMEIRDTTLYIGVADQPEKLTKTGFADAVKAADSSS